MEFLILINVLFSLILVILILYLCKMIKNSQNDAYIEDLIKSNMQNNVNNAIYTINKELASNNEKVLINFRNFGFDMSKVIHENNDSFKNSITQFKDELKKSINYDFMTLSNQVDKKLTDINARVEEKLADGFKETTKTFTNVLERLAKIDEAQKKIESLSINVSSLQNVLTDKKTRGIFGEIQLAQILYSAFGEEDDKKYRLQYKLSNGKIADAVIFAPEPLGNIVIDSKFPLENYRRLYENDNEQGYDSEVNVRQNFSDNVNRSSDNDFIENYEYSDDIIKQNNVSIKDKMEIKKMFERDFKKHIDAIAEKYIIKKETSDQAILFLPAEAIFADVNARHQSLLDYANKKNVRIASPTTLMAILTIVQLVLRNIEREKYANIIHKELISLQDEFKRYEKRWTSLENDINKVVKSVKDITITSNKISKRFDNISNVEFSNNINNSNNKDDINKFIEKGE